MFGEVVRFVVEGEGKLLGGRRGVHRLSILDRKEYARGTMAKAVR